MKRKEFPNWVVYQIYPRSFRDSNGDGIGDLNGIIEKLDYLKELGVNAVWLSPCYKSPNCDNGYDISDYRDIMDEFGTLDDWKRMIFEMHARGIKLIMDFVANHTSSEHAWFNEARTSRENPYHDYYIWRDEIPNDWQSCFGGSAWEYNEPTGEYYLHSFAIGQPDLNWENPKVRQEMCAVVDYWVGLGVDGFRCDVLNFISKDFGRGLMCDGPRLHEYVKELFGREETENLFTVGECSYGEDEIENICGENRKELTCVFQFDHFGIGRTGDKFVKAELDLNDLRKTLVKWQEICERKNLLYTLFTDNHDQAHYISRAGDDGKYRYECATAYCAMFYLLKGIPFIYQGQEWGTPDPHYSSVKDYCDVETINYYNAHKEEISESELLARINFGSRDNARRPLCWTQGKNFGFGEGEPWTKLHSRGEEVNLEKDRASEKSVFAFYQKTLALRRESEAIRYGSFEDRTRGEGYFAYARKYGEEEILVVVNFDGKSEISGLPEWEYLFGNGRRRSANGAYAPYETAVFRNRREG